MKSIVKKYITLIISVVTIAIICIVWLANGAELEDAWLYAFSIFIVVIPAIESYFKSKNKDQ